MARPGALTTTSFLLPERRTAARPPRRYASLRKASMARAFTAAALSPDPACDRTLGVRVDRPDTVFPRVFASVHVTEPSPPCEKWQVYAVSPPPASLDVTAASLPHLGHSGSIYESLHGHQDRSADGCCPTLGRLSPGRSSGACLAPP